MTEQGTENAGTVRVSISFNCGYETAAGEQLALVGNCPELSEPVHLINLRDSIWQKEVTINMIETDGNFKVPDGATLTDLSFKLKKTDGTELLPEDTEHSLKLNSNLGRWFEVEIVRGVEHQLSPVGMECHFKRLPDISEVEDVKDLIEKFEWKRQSEPWLETVYLVALSCLHTHPDMADLPQALELLDEAEQLDSSSDNSKRVSAKYLIKTARLKLRSLQSCDGFPKDWQGDVEELESLWNPRDDDDFSDDSSASRQLSSVGWILLRCGFGKLTEAEEYFTEASEKDSSNFYGLFGLAVTKSRIRRSRDNRCAAEKEELELWEKAEQICRESHRDTLPLLLASYAEATLNSDGPKAKELIENATRELNESYDNYSAKKCLSVLVTVLSVCRKLCKKLKGEDRMKITEISAKAFRLASKLLNQSGSNEWYESPDLHHQMAHYLFKQERKIEEARKHFKKADPENNIWVAKSLIDLDQNQNIFDVQERKSEDDRIEWICQRYDSLCLRPSREAHKAHVVAEKGYFLAINGRLAEGAQCIAWALNEYAGDEPPNWHSCLSEYQKNELKKKLGHRDNDDARFILSFIDERDSAAAVRECCREIKAQPNINLSFARLSDLLNNSKLFLEFLRALDAKFPADSVRTALESQRDSWATAAMFKFYREYPENDTFTEDELKKLLSNPTEIQLTRFKEKLWQIDGKFSATSVLAALNQYPKWATAAKEKLRQKYQNAELKIDELEDLLSASDENMLAKFIAQIDNGGLPAKTVIAELREQREKLIEDLLAATTNYPHQLWTELQGVLHLELEQFDAAKEKFELLDSKLPHRRELIADSIMSKLSKLEHPGTQSKAKRDGLLECLRLKCKDAGQQVLEFLQGLRNDFNNNNNKVRPRVSGGRHRVPKLHHRDQYELVARLLNLRKSSTSFFTKKRLLYKKLEILGVEFDLAMQDSYEKAVNEAEVKFRDICDKVKEEFDLNPYPRQALLSATRYHLIADRQQEKKFLKQTLENSHKVLDHAWKSFNIQVQQSSELTESFPPVAYFPFAYKNSSANKDQKPKKLTKSSEAEMEKQVKRYQTEPDSFSIESLTDDIGHYFNGSKKLNFFPAVMDSDNKEARCLVKREHRILSSEGAWIILWVWSVNEEKHAMQLEIDALEEKVQRLLTADGAPRSVYELAHRAAEFAEETRLLLDDAAVARAVDSAKGADAIFSIRGLYSICAKTNPEAIAKSEARAMAKTQPKVDDETEDFGLSEFLNIP